jgi:hypothetical protein
MLINFFSTIFGIFWGGSRLVYLLGMLVLVWVVPYMCLLLFLRCFVLLSPFLHRFVAIGLLVVLCYFIVDLLGVEFGSCFFLRI